MGSSSSPPATSRILVVDALRGLCLVLMTLGHLPENPVYRFENFVFGAFGFFTGASGFVFLSGWITGRVYGAHRRSFGDASLRRRVLLRLAKLYAAQLILILAIGLPIACHFLDASNLHLTLFSSHPLRAFLLAAALIYHAGYLGILPMYFVFLALTPWLLRQLQKGYAWRVIAASAAIWLLPLILTRNTLQDDLKFNPLSYQILFVGAMILGDQRLSLDQLAPRVRQLLVVVCAVLSVLFFSLRLSYAIFKPIRLLIDGPFYQLFSLGEMGPARLLSFAVFVVSLWSICRDLYPVVSKNLVFDWLVMLGQNSLVVFTWSVTLTAMLTMLGLHSSTRTGRIDVMLLAIGSLSIPALLGSAATKMQRRIPEAAGNQAQLGASS